MQYKIDTGQAVHEIQSMDLSRTVNTAIAIYLRQKVGNVGLVYEAAALLHFVRRMGLDNSTFAAIAPIIQPLSEKISAKKRATWAAWLANYSSTPIGAGYDLEGRRVVDIVNVTQSDDMGGTGDLVLKLDDGSERSISIHCGEVQQSGAIKKCLTNPSYKRFGCTDEHKKIFDQIAKDAKGAYIAEMTARHPDKSTWKNIPRGHADRTTVAACKATTEVARITVDHFCKMPPEAQKKMADDLLCITGGKRPADYALVVCEDLSRFRLFRIISAKVDTSKITVRQRGFWIDFVSGDDKVIGSTQVKFNNGVWRENKSGKWAQSSICTSWNSTFNLADVFEMAEI